MIEKTVEALRSARSVVITSHIQPDGDALGSMLGMLRSLKAMGKQVRAVSPSHVPYVFTFMLESPDEVVRYDPSRDDPVLAAADLFLILDCAVPERAGEVGKKMVELGNPMLMIDHHSTNEFPGDWNYIIHEASSTAALCLNVIDQLGVSLTLSISIPLYIGIATDTGNFSYPSTTPATHEKAARLLRAGVNPYEIHRKLALDQTIDFIRLTGLALFNVQFASGGEIAYSVVGNELYQRFHPRVDELVMLPSYLISIRDVEVGILFLEYAPRKILVELRSQGLINVATLAKSFSGGGHSGAAGLRIEGEMADIVHQVVQDAALRLELAHAKGDEEARRARIWRRV